MNCAVFSTRIDTLRKTAEADKWERRCEVKLIMDELVEQQKPLHRRAVEEVYYLLAT